MEIKLWHQITLSSLMTLSCAIGAWAHADVFSDYTLEQAKQESQKDHKFLLIDFTASWCPPCKGMESYTWTDDAVQAWIKENAIAIQIDVGKDEKTSESLNVKEIPTLVLFTPQSGSSEFARQVGFMNSSQLLRWLEGAKSGKSAAALETVQPASEGNHISIRISKAREMQSVGQNAEALEEYIRLWNISGKGDPSLPDLRVSLIPYDIKKLTLVYSPAKSKFTEIRDAAEKADNLHDWLILNTILNDNARTLAWFDKAKTDPKQRENITKNTSLIESVLFATKRWADAANFFYPEPLTAINDMYKRAQDMKKPRPDTEVAKDFDPFPSMVLMVYGVYVGAGREAEAQKIADECLRLDDTPSMRDGLNNMAKGMHQARAAHSQAKPPSK
jgi:thiol-disulfide isomerase/thioredoxin